MSRGELRAARWVAPRRHPLTKVPEVTAYFWITKVLTTGMGEATSDYLVHRFSPEIAVVASFTAFVAAMASSTTASVRAMSRDPCAAQRNQL